MPGSSPVRKAVIDVGTNSVKLLVGDILGKSVHAIHETSEQTRLGKGYYPDHRLQPAAIESTAHVVHRFSREAIQLGSSTIRVIGTSAARDARNADELVDAIRSASGLELEIISGEQEAEWGFAGVTSDSRWSSEALLILDVGGGSTEFMLGDHGTLRFRSSYPLGSVRLNESFPPSDTPAPSEKLAAQNAVSSVLRDLVIPQLDQHRQLLSQVHRVVGIGGTTAILALIHLQSADFNRSLIESTEFSVDILRRLTDRLWSLSLSERRRLTGLPPERADVILMGATIYMEILEHLEIPNLAISLRGLRYAALLDLGGPVVASGLPIPVPVPVPIEPPAG